MNHFIVMQSASHEEEISGGYMWSPQKNKANGINHAYERMTEVKKGDVTFSCYDKAIRAIGIATSDVYENDQPEELLQFQQWAKKGYKVNVDFTMLENPIIIAENWEEMKDFRPEKYSAFQKNGSGNQAYLFEAMPEWVDLFNEFIDIPETEREKDKETFVDGEIVDEIQASSSIEQGIKKVESKTARGRVKKNRVSSQDDIQKDLKKRKEIGDIAEAKVYEYVEKMVANVFGQDYADKVEHVAKTKGDGLGYDILAYDYQNPTTPPKQIVIEVKGTTSTDKLESYFISYPELEKFIRHKDNLWLVRVFGVTKEEKLIMEIDNDFSQYESASELMEKKYAYIPSIIEVFGTRIEGE